MLLLASRRTLMIKLCLEINYYYLNIKTAPISIDPNTTFISVIYIALASTKLFT